MCVTSRYGAKSGGISDVLPDHIAHGSQAAPYGFFNSRIVMQTFLIIIGIWLLINVLFVVVMIPPRKPRAEDPPRSSMGPTFATLEGHTHHFEEEEKGAIRHTIIALAMGVLFSLTPPLIEAIDDIKRLIKTSRKSGGPRHEGTSNAAPSLDDRHYPKDN